jgi:UDP-glucose:(heptosyl)LPS alpha-1,3-glucosyltransferase
LKRYHPPAVRLQQDGPLRLCFVGSLDFRKGFVYLLRAMRLIGPSRVSLEIVGATGDRYCAKLLAREGAGLNIKYAPGNPVSAYHQAELFVLPTLEDGSPFAVAEAMACGLPVIVTDSCGSAEWVRSGQSGWVVRAAHPEALAAAMEDALNRRRDLISMGLLARQDVEHRAGASCFSNISEWAYRQN